MKGFIRGQVVEVVYKWRCPFCGRGYEFLTLETAESVIHNEMASHDAEAKFWSSSDFPKCYFGGVLS